MTSPYDKTSFDKSPFDAAPPNTAPSTTGPFTTGPFDTVAKTPPRSRRKPTVFVGLVLLLVLVLAGGWLLVTRVFLRQDFTLTADAPAAGAIQVRISGSNAEITLEPSPDTSVHVRATGHYATSQPRVSAVADGGVVTVTVRCPDEILGSCTINATVGVPAELPVQADTDNGDVNAAQLAGSLNLQTDNGDIDVSDASGGITLQTSNGNITVSSASSQLKAVTSNGDVDVTLSAVPDTVEVRSNNGGLDVRVPGSGRYLVNAQSDNGQVDIGVPQDSDSTHVITAETDNGEVRVHST